MFLWFIILTRAYFLLFCSASSNGRIRGDDEVRSFYLLFVFFERQDNRAKMWWSTTPLSLMDLRHMLYAYYYNIVPHDSIPNSFFSCHYVFTCQRWTVIIATFEIWMKLPLAMEYYLIHPQQTFTMMLQAMAAHLMAKAADTPATTLLQMMVPIMREAKKANPGQSWRRNWMRTWSLSMRHSWIFKPWWLS